MSATITEPRVDTAPRDIARTRVVRDLAGFAEIRNQWNELVNQSTTASVFQTWEWTDAWLRSYGEKKLMIVAGDDHAGLAGIMPLYVGQWPKLGTRSLKVLRFLSDNPDDAGTLGLIARAGAERAFADAAIGWLVAHRNEWDALELNMLPSEQFAPLMTALRKHEFVSKDHSASHRVLALPARTERIAGKPMTTARKSVEKLGPRTIQIKRCETKTEIEQTVEELFRLHALRWNAKKKAGAFATPNRKKFYRILSAAMFEAGKLDAWNLNIDGKIAAAEFGLISNKVRYSMQAGFDPAYRAYRVGTILDANIIEAAIERGLKSYDFLVGDETFKRDWGAAPESYHFVRCAPAGTMGALWARASSVRLLQKLWARMK